MDHNLLNDQQYKEKVDLLLELIGNINSNLEVKSVLLHIIEAAMKITDSEASTVYLLDSAKNELILTVPSGPISEKIHGRRFPVTHGIAGWVARNSIPQIVNDVASDDRFYGDLEPGIFTTNSILCVPLKNQSEEVIGVLQALNKKNGADYEESEISLFQVLAHQAAIAITNARLHDERKTLLSEIHHRVKNNMAVISGMIQLQAYNEADEEMQDKLLKGVTRISSMAMVHEELYEAESFSNLNYSQNLKKVVNNTVKTLQKEMRVLIKYEIDAVVLNINQSIPCSLIVSEIIFYIVKFGFRRSENPEIRVFLEENSANEFVTLKIEDNGDSIATFFSEDADEISDFRLIEVLAQQLNADFTYEVDKDCDCNNKFVISFQKADYGGAGNQFL